MKGMRLHCVLLALGAGSAAELGSAGARGNKGAIGAWGWHGRGDSCDGGDWCDGGDQYVALPQDTHCYTQSPAPCAEFTGVFIGFSTATTQSPLASQTPAAGGSGRVSAAARVGRVPGAAPGASCAHLVPFSHQNEVNFLPKADTAAGKPGKASAWSSNSGLPPSRLPNRCICPRLQEHHILPSAPGHPCITQPHLNAEEHHCAVLVSGSSPHLQSVCLLVPLPPPAGFWRKRSLLLFLAVPLPGRQDHAAQPPWDQPCCLLRDEESHR